MILYWPWGLAFLVTIPLIVLLYLLKQKHPPVLIPSLDLWNDVLKDVQASSPWQRLKKNLLMFIQIALMILLCLSVAKPFLNVDNGISKNYVLVIDSSFSMQAEDISPSRFEKAKIDTIDFITNTPPNTKITLVNLGYEVVIKQNLSEDKGVLINTIQNLKVTNGSFDIESAKSVIKSIIQNSPTTQISLFSDTPINIDGVNTIFNEIKGNGANYAITGLTHSKLEKEVTLLSKIANFSQKDVKLPVSLYVNGKIFDAKNIEIEKGKIKNIFWTNLPLSSKVIECRIDKKDSLNKDNYAFDTINDSTMQKVILISEKNIFIEKVLKLIDGVELYKGNIENIDSLKGYDLYIYDGVLPKELPQDGNIMIFNPNENKYFAVHSEIENINLKKSSNKIFDHIDDYSFIIGKSKSFTLPKWGELLLDSNKGILAFQGKYKNSNLVAFGFDLHNTDLPLKIAFPILINNSIEYLLQKGISNNINNITPGQDIEFNLQAKTKEVYVSSPENIKEKLAPPFPIKVYSNTKEVGVYTLEEVLEEGVDEYKFAVNVPSNIESNLQKVYTSISESNESNTQDAKKALTGLNLQYILMWIILSLILIEWWVYTNDL